MFSPGRPPALWSIFLLVLYSPLKAWDPGFGYPIMREVIGVAGGLEEYTWNMVWDRDGVAYLGRERLWRWDGVELKAVGPDGFRFLRALAVDAGDRIWLGGVNKFGVYDPGADTYESRLEWIPEGQRNLGPIWEIHHEGEHVWVGTSNTLFRLSERGAVSWNFSGKHRVIFHFLDAGVFAHETGVGLWKIEGDERLLVNEDPRLKEKSVIYLMENSGQEFVCLSGAGLFKIERENFTIVDLKFTSKLEGLAISSVEERNENSLVIGTLGQGLFLLSTESESFIPLNQRKEFVEQLVLRVVKDPSDSFWILGRSIWSIGLKLPAGLIDERLGLSTGTTNAIYVEGNSAYILKDNGFYHQIHPHLDYPFPISKSLLNTRSLSRQPDGIYYDRYNRLMKLVEGETEEVADFGAEIGSFVITRGGGFAVSFHDHVGLYRKTAAGGLEVSGRIEVDRGLEKLGMDGDGRIWGWGALGALLKVEEEPDGSWRHTWIEEVAGLDLGEEDHEFVITEKGPVLIFRDGIARSSGAGEPWEHGNLPVGWGLPHGIDIEAGDGGLRGYGAYWDPELEMYLLREIHWPDGGQPEGRVIPWIDLRELGKVHVIEMGGEDGERLFFGGMQGLLVAERRLSEELPGPRRPLLYREGEDKPVTGQLTFAYGEDRLQFHYRSPGGGEHFPLRYQSRLGGETEEWTEPSRVPFRELGRIPGGNHRFEVRAVDPFGRYSPTATVGLRILSPWYATGGAYVAYVLLLLMLGVSIIRIRERSMRARQLDLEEQVRERTAELVEANAFKDDFIANLSHEIRNPLTGVIGFIGRLKPGASISGRHLEALRGAAEYLHTTVDQVLDFSRLESGRIDLESKPFAVVERLRGTIEIYRQEAGRKGIRLTSQIRVPDGVAVVSDAGKLQQIIGNLTGNAIKFTDEGSVHVGISLDEVEGEGTIRIWVKDTGRGVAEEDRERIFHKFCQVRHGASKTPGTGLGLTLVKTFVDRLGGTLDLKTEPGRGSTFFVTLPVAVQPEEVLRGETDSEDPGFLAGLTVLVVEDHEYNRIFLEDLLTDFGCVVDSAEEGPRGLELARTGDYAVILLDWDLPGMKGLEIARNLREDPHCRGDLRIIGMTAFATPDVPVQCLEAGMDTFLNKPVLPDQLRKVLRFCLQERALVRGPGILAEMARQGDWKGVAARWADYSETYLGELEASLEGEDPEVVRKAAHRFLGHLRMIEMEELPDAVTDLLTAAQAGDGEGVRREWDVLRPLFWRFRNELDRLRETGSPGDLTRGYGTSSQGPSA